MKNKIIRGAVFSAIATFFLFNIARAQEEKMLQPADCFEFYKFQSVLPEVLPDSNTATAGTKFSGTVAIKNNNSYPIINGSVYFKIYKKQADEKLKVLNGDFLMDQFFAGENIHLNAKETKVVPFEWAVPSVLASGEYYIASYFQSAGKFNLAGLAFTDDVVGSIAPIAVIGDMDATVQFDKNAVKLNGENFNFIGATRTFPAGQEIAVEAPLKNSFPIEIKADISFDVYYWDNLLQTNRVYSETKSVSVGPNGTEIINHLVKPNDFAVNYVVITAKYSDGKSILPIRFGKSGIESARINFPGILNFPLKKDQKTTIFSCAHAVKDPQNQEGIDFSDFLVSEGLIDKTAESAKKDSAAKTQSGEYDLELSLIDKSSGSEIKSFHYRGNIGGDMQGFAADFVPEKNFNQVTLTAVLKNKNGDVIDRADMEYDCARLGLDNCSSASVGSDPKKESVSMTIILVLTVICATIILLFYYLVKKIKNSRNLTGLVLFAVISGSLFLFSGGKVFARTANPEVNFEGLENSSSIYAAYKSPFSFNGGIYWMQLQINRPTVVYSSLNSLGEGQAIAARWDPVMKVWTSAYRTQDIYPGQVFTVKLSQEASWNNTGFYIDTPFAHWRENAELTDDLDRLPSDKVRAFSSGCFYPYDHGVAIRKYFPNAPVDSCKAVNDLYTPVVFAPPGVTLKTTGPISCVKMGDYWQCTVDSAAANGAPVLVEAVFENTYGRVYAITDTYLDYFYGNTPDYEINMGYKSELYSTLKCSGGNDAFNRGITDKSGSCSLIKQHSCGGQYEYQTFSGCFSGAGACSPCDDQTKINVKEAGIKYEYVVKKSSGNNPPSTPKISGPIQGVPGAVNEFSVVSTDPDGDNLQYGIDWDKNGLVDQWLPASGYVVSGISQPFSKIYGSKGNFSFQALARDVKGLVSGWATHNIVINEECVSSWQYRCTSEQTGNSCQPDSCSGFVVKSFGKCEKVDVVCNPGIFQPAGLSECQAAGLSCENEIENCHCEEEPDSAPKIWETSP